MRFIDYILFGIFVILLGTAVLVFATFPGHAASAQQDKCITINSMIEQIKRRTPAAKIKTLNGGPAASYMKQLNTIPPISRFVVPDKLLLIAQPGTSSIFIIGFKDHCHVGYLQIRKALHKNIMRTVFGQEA